MATVTKKVMKKQAQWVTKSGAVVTEDDAAAMAAAFESDETDLADAEARPVGRPSLSPRSAGGASPRVSVRLGDEAYAALNARAEHEHRSVSDLAREAIESYIAG